MQRCPNSKNRGVVCGEESHFVTLWEKLFRTRRKSVVDKGQSKVAGSIPTPSPPPGLGGGGRAGAVCIPKSGSPGCRSNVLLWFRCGLGLRRGRLSRPCLVVTRFNHVLSLSRSLALSLFGPAGHRCLFRKLSKPAKKKEKKDSSIGVRDLGGGRYTRGLWKPLEVVGRPTKRGPLPRRLRLTHHTATLEGNRCFRNKSF